jgi:hypothetical protein
MNELVKQLIEFSKTSNAAGFCIFFIVLSAMYYTGQTIIYVAKWVAIAIRGYAPKGTKIKDEI